VPVPVRFPVNQPDFQPRSSLILCSSTTTTTTSKRPPVSCPSPLPRDVGWCPPFPSSEGCGPSRQSRMRVHPTRMTLGSVTSAVSVRGIQNAVSSYIFRMHLLINLLDLDSCIFKVGTIIAKLSVRRLRRKQK